MEPLTFIGLVTDNNNPAYANRDLALVSFTSNTQIPVAQRASVRTNDQSAIKSQYYIAGYPFGLTNIINGTPYRNDFTRDPEAHIGKPLINTGKVLSDGPSLKGFVTQMITVPADIAEFRPIMTVQRIGREYLLTPGLGSGINSQDRSPWNPSGIVIYNANTHSGHSGSPVLNKDGKILAIHTNAIPAIHTNGKPGSSEKISPYRSQAGAYGSFLDSHTIKLMNSLIQIEKNKINKK
jgi:hypothetical protein